MGIPITEAAYLIRGQGIRFVGFRHEQQAGMAAATEGFLTKKPGVLMTVSSLRIHERPDSHSQRHRQLLSYDTDLRRIGSDYGRHEHGHL